MYKLKTGYPKTLLVTQKLANEFLNMEPAPQDRPLSETRLRVYRKLLEDGTFRTVTWAAVECVETNCTYRVNGKHTSTLFSGMQPLPKIHIILEYYECPTLQDVGRLYGTFDSSLASRTARDIYLSFAGTVDSLRGLSHYVINVAASGIAFASFGGDTYRRSTAPERAEMLIEHDDFVCWLNQLILGGEGTDGATKNTRRNAHLGRQGVVAAMFQCYQRDQEVATTFWEEVRDETAPDPNRPTRRLGRFLLTTGLQASQGRTNKNRATLREIYVKCIHAWNAWRKGQTSNLYYTASKPVPEVL